MTQKTAKYWIEKLELKKHPEGGWFRETYRSQEIAGKVSLPENFSGQRNFSTSIYFLLVNEDISALHRIMSDEIWHYYAGDSTVEIVSLEGGKMQKNFLGPNIDESERFQIVIPKNTWFGARLINRSGYALVGCTVSPGFQFEDFELADKSLLKEYPELKDNISLFLKN